MTVDLDAYLAAYVAMLERCGAVRSPMVAQAFRTVRRDRCIAAFYDPATGNRVQVPQDIAVPEKLLDVIYSDRALMTHLDVEGQAPTSSSSQPTLMAAMLEALDLRPGMRVLEIGAGTGYNAALLSEITGAEVVTVEAGAEVSEDARQALQRVGANAVHVVHADGYFGYEQGAPYQRIIATVACAGVPGCWLGQLDTGGLILAPIFHAGVHPLLRVWPDTDGVRGQAVQWADFMRATGLLYQMPVDRSLRTSIMPATSRTDYVAGSPLEFDSYVGLWFYLGVRDPRATRVPAESIKPSDGQCALVDLELGKAFVLRDGRVILDGYEHLVDDVVRYRCEWEDLGRPAIRDWSCHFAPTGSEGAPLSVPNQWLLRGHPINEVLAGSPSTK